MWQWVFPAPRTHTDPASQEVRRHHLHEAVLQRAIRRAAVAAKILKPVTPHTLRHYAESPVMPSEPIDLVRSPVISAADGLA